MKIDFSKASIFLKENDEDLFLKKALSALKDLKNKEGAGSEYDGWLLYPETYDKDELKRIKEASKRINENSGALVVIGIGGSYLGAAAALSALFGSFFNSRRGLKVYFAGNNLSGEYINGIIDEIGDKDFSINVISKSGGTMESAVGFRLFKDLLEKRYGEKGARERIFVTTDSERGLLKNLSDAKGYETFTIPDDIGGRYSVMTSVGLLPICAAAGDVDALLAGAKAAMEEYLKESADNVCVKYAAVRNALYQAGKEIEIFCTYEPRLTMLCEWLKQLFGESEGKENKGIYPSSLAFTTDLHSMGQYVQSGKRNLFETVLWLDTGEDTLRIPHMAGDLDELDFIAGKDMREINEKAFLGTRAAHVEGGVPVITLSLDKMDAFSLGRLFYFFELSCAISGYILGVNPFDQPGVESYKKNMLALLGKPGYEAGMEKLLKFL